MSFKLAQKIELNPVPMTGNKDFILSDYAGKNIVLYFYPKDSTPGCTNESIDFASHHQQFLDNNTVIFGVSKDTLKSHEKFKAKYQMPFDLIADTEKYLCQAFDVLKEKSMFGKKYMGIERSTFVIGGNGVLVEAWRKVKVSGHVEQILQFIKSLK
ncbi:peroxiredoxin [Facilibium subflavum]|uniref:peroxiredoxin n=1 Tax=Facilibium subflavum TaxID=2219058 RepID=UPI001AADCBC9|nr:peroxiredoxin [Facilibium subflavum]